MVSVILFIVVNIFCFCYVLFDVLFGVFDGLIVYRGLDLKWMFWIKKLFEGGLIIEDFKNVFWK